VGAGGSFVGADGPWECDDVSIFMQVARVRQVRKESW
jgi:hypothetical protein